MNITVTTGILGTLAASLMRGEDNAISRLVHNKLEGAGRRLIRDLISATPIGVGLAVAGRASEFLETGGAREFALPLPSMPSAPSFVRRLASSLRREADRYERDILRERGRWRRMPRWRRSGWARSRREWLREGWRHDWRSQPRDIIGRWVPGRLDYPVAQYSRRQLRIRQIRKLSRAYGRQWAKQTFRPKKKLTQWTIKPLVGGRLKRSRPNTGGSPARGIRSSWSND